MEYGTNKFKAQIGAHLVRAPTLSIITIFYEIFHWYEKSICAMSERFHPSSARRVSSH
jgi:hypothetical protein